MRIGLIGLGRIGAFHADTLAALDGVDELVVTDPVEAAVEAVTGRIPKARAVSSPEALLDAGVDAVSLLEDDRVVYGPMSLHPPA